MENKEAIIAFYKKCLTVNAETNTAEVLEQILADDFQSINTKETKGKAQLIGQIGFFWKLIPNLTWEPQDMICDGNKFVVRSKVTGTPNGDFMGVSCNGTKSFTIMSIDFHTLENGQLKLVHHIEEWGDAIKQLQ